MSQFAGDSEVTVEQPVPMEVVPLRYAITDRARFPGDEPARQAALVRNATGWAADCLDFIQLREKDLAAGALAALARKLLEALGTGDRSPRLLINSRADVAVAVAADGVHLTSASGELTPAQVRRLYAAAGLPEPVVSVSCHTLDEVARARDSAASLILLARSLKKWPLQSAPEHNPSPQAAARLAEGSGLTCSIWRAPPRCPRPVLALGGVTAENTDACLAAGAAGIAAIRLFRAVNTSRRRIDRGRA